MTTARFKTLVIGSGLTGTDNADGTITVDADPAAPASPADDTLVWMPLADSDGTLVLDADGALIPTLIPI